MNENVPSLSMQYLAILQAKLSAAISEQQALIQSAAAQIAASLRQGGLLYVFGSGHSHLLAEELYVRAGGLAPVHAILAPELMLHEDVDYASRLERLPQYADTVLKDLHWRSGDVLLVISNSGSNGLPVEVALRGRQSGLLVIALTSVSFSSSIDARHPSGRRLFETANLVLDNYGQPGDACLQVPGVEPLCGPTSTAVGAALLHALMAETIGRLAQEGLAPPVFVSGNFSNNVGAGLEAAKKAGQRWRPV
jgi:uncharacterized phosphosugar-binding protein